jgi:hypothetical protein
MPLKRFKKDASFEKDSPALPLCGKFINLQLVLSTV